jgi:GT2 family glycosyltransferase
VTAVIVGHDGAGWLSHGLDALLEQTKPVQRTVAVDTGSRDRSGSVLAGKLGQTAVFGMERSTGYAAAVRRALQHKAASAPLPVPAGSAARGRPEQVEWIWLLHDDCEPAPDALEQLLRGAAETPTAAVLGPKLMDWTDRDVVLETGLSLDAVGRRTTGIEPREVDQGQHDGDRDVLAVSSAGMLVRRDVWNQVGGFDPGMALFGEDIDLCWRVHAAGFRVRVITDAVVYHAMAATRGRRPISVGRRARLLDRRNGLLTLLGNLPVGPMLVSLLANVAISVVRTLFYTVAKRGTAALDEAAAVAGVIGHPLRFAAARRRRASGRRAAYSRVRADLPPGHSLRRAAEFLSLVLARAAKSDGTAGPSAIDDPDEDDSLLTDSGFLQRFVTRPGVLLLLGLIVITAVAEHSLIGGGPLGGGALTPAWEGSSTLWGEVLQAFHPVGIGSASAAPPSAGFVALLATILLGKTWLAIDVLLLGCVPLAGVTALLALRRLTRSAPVRVWAAAAYALLPVAFGAISAGRLGSVVAFVLIPLIGLAAGRMFTESARLARRAAWATGLLVTVGTAFVPVLWPMAIIGAVLAAATMRRSRAMLINLLIVAATPLVLLLPWMLQLLAHPSALLLETGVQQPGLAAAGLPARSLLLLSPGGPGLPPYWVSGALVLVALLALLATRRRVLIVSGWCAALLGFGTAVVASRATVTPAGGQAMTPWPGPALAVAAAGLILASVAGADSLSRLMGARGRKAAGRLTGARGLAAAVIGLAAVSAPVLAGAYWLLHPVTGPVRPAQGEIVPAFGSAGGGRQLRTLVLSSVGGRVSYLLLRGNSPLFADSGLVPVSGAQTALTAAVAALVAPGGGLAADQSEQLARFDIGYVLMRAPENPQLVSILNSVAGLTTANTTGAFDQWRLASLPSRVSVVQPSGAVVPINSGPVSVSGAAAPGSGGILELAEPAGGWQAALNGHALTPVASPAGSWAQAFRLPAGGGTLSVSRSSLLHDLMVALELLAILVVGVLALPGVRTAAELEAAAAAGARLEAETEIESEADGLPAAAAAAAAAGPADAPGRTGTPARASRRRTGVPGKPGRPGRRKAKSPADEESVGSQPGRRGVPARAMRGAAGKAAAGRAGRGKAATDAAVTGATVAGAAAGAAAAAAASGIAAAGQNGTGTDRAGTDRAGADRTGADRTGADRTGAGAPVRAAWPAGQPASRFISGPPESRPSRPEGDPAGWPQRDRSAPPWADEEDFGRPAARLGMSPSGSGFDDLPDRPEPVPPGSRFDGYPPDDTDRPVRRPGRHGEPAARGASPSGSQYDDQPAERWASSPPQHVPDRPGPMPGADYPAEPPYGGQYGGQRPYEPAADWPDRDRQDAAWRPAEQSSWSDDDQASAWPSAGGQPSWGHDQPVDDQRGWPQDDQRGWSQDDQRGWPGEHREDYSAPSAEPEWGVPDQAPWPDQGDVLEALPPVGEVHHDWPDRAERPSRGWIAPSDDTDGDSW